MSIKLYKAICNLILIVIQFIFICGYSVFRISITNSNISKNYNLINFLHVINCNINKQNIIIR